MPRRHRCHIEEIWLNLPGDAHGSQPQGSPGVTCDFRRVAKTGPLLANVTEKDRLSPRDFRLLKPF